MGPRRVVAGIVTLGLAAGCSFLAPDEATVQEPDTAVPQTTTIPPGWAESTVTLPGTNAAKHRVPNHGLVGDANFLVSGAFDKVAIWRSVDLTRFELVYREASQLEDLVVAGFDQSILVGGEVSGPPSSTDVRYLRSHDGGDSWAEIEDRLLSDDVGSITDMVASDDTVIVVTEKRTRDQPKHWSAAWSDDLATWNRVELPDADPLDELRFMTVGATVYALAPRFDQSQTWAGRWAVWRSDDGGRSFEPQPANERPGHRFMATPQGLVLFPTLDEGDDPEIGPSGVSILGSDGKWTSEPSHNGTWGDDHVRVLATATLPDASYAVVARTTRASIDYCFVDVTTCYDSDPVLMRTSDGVNWATVVEAPVPPHELNFSFWLTAGPNGGPAFIATDANSPPIVVTRWTPTEPPTAQTPADYVAPELDVPAYVPGEPFEVGERRRLDPVYSCGATRLATGPVGDEQNWKPDPPLPMPLPKSWPVRHEMDVDEPISFIYGTAVRTGPDSIEFSIADHGVVTTFRPIPEPGYWC